MTPRDMPIPIPAMAAVENAFEELLAVVAAAIGVLADVGVVYALLGIGRLVDTPTEAGVTDALLGIGLLVDAITEAGVEGAAVDVVDVEMVDVVVVVVCATLVPQTAMPPTVEGAVKVDIRIRVAPEFAGLITVKTAPEGT